MCNGQPDWIEWRNNAVFVDKSGFCRDVRKIRLEAFFRTAWSDAGRVGAIGDGSSGKDMKRVCGRATLADARCPEAVRLLEEIQKEPENESGIENLKVAPIEPILLHCARELSTRPDLADGEKIITTPCQSLAVLGNSLGLENTRFIAWNRLAGGEVRVRAIEDSPIPPGGILRESAGKMDRRRR